MTKKIEPIEALAKIKILIKRFYEDIGREVIDMEMVRQDLIEDIEEIVDKTNIPMKNLIMESLEKPEEEHDVYEEEG